MSEATEDVISIETAEGTIGPAGYPIAADIDYNKINPAICGVGRYLAISTPPLSVSNLEINKRIQMQ